MNAPNSRLGLADGLVWAAAFASASATIDLRSGERLIVLPGSAKPSPLTSPAVLRELHHIAARAVLRARGQIAEPTDLQVAALHDFMLTLNSALDALANATGGE